ncbi:Ku protein [Streptomyces sp. NPDC059837]|uniref:Ku protein n=1 Tax=Streptomyces sp. NPDC059837 TaxID=3346968 RepID=UPI0036629F19
MGRAHRLPQIGHPAAQLRSYGYPGSPVLRHAVERASKIAIARYAWHGRERLGPLRVRGDVIASHGLLWPDEIRDPAAVVPPPVRLDTDAPAVPAKPAKKTPSRRASSRNAGRAAGRPGTPARLTCRGRGHDRGGGQGVSPE